MVRHSLGQLGGALGILVGALSVTPHIAPDVTKVIFTAVATSFAVVLLVVSRRSRESHDRVLVIGLLEKSLFVVVGVVGGLLSSAVGTGLDIVVFSLLVLLFRINERVATPTSVILMGINSIVGVATYGGLLGQINPTVYGYWMAAIPVVVVGAPLGAMLCTCMSRKLIANLLISLIFFELVTTLLIIPLREPMVLWGGGTLLCCLTIYGLMVRSRRYTIADNSA